MSPEMLAAVLLGSCGLAAVIGAAVSILRIRR